MGEGCRFGRVSEISRADHVTVDNAVLGSPIVTRLATGCAREIEADPRRQPQITWSMLVLLLPSGRKAWRLQKGRLRKGRSMSSDLMRMDAQTGQPVRVIQPGVECLASARYESWLHRSRKHIHHCSLLRRFVLETAWAGSVGRHIVAAIRGGGVWSVKRFHVHVRSLRWLGDDGVGVPGRAPNHQSRDKVCGDLERDT